MSFCACESKSNAPEQCLSRLSVSNTQRLPSFITFFCSVFLLIAVFYPALARPAVMNVRGDREALEFFLLGKSGGRGGAEFLVRGSRWPPRLSPLFKEHCGRSPESNKPDYTACGNLRPLRARLPILAHQDLMLKFSKRLESAPLPAAADRI